MSERERLFTPTPPEGCACAPTLHAHAARLEVVDREIGTLRSRQHEHGNELAKIKQSIVDLDPTVERVTELRIMEARLEKVPDQIADLAAQVAGLERLATRMTALVAIVAALFGIFGGRILDRVLPARDWRARQSAVSAGGGTR